MKDNYQGIIKVRKNNQSIYINKTDICYFKADGNYTHIFLKTGKSYIKSVKLKCLEEKIELGSFFRCHRSYIINLHEINVIDFENRVAIQKLYQIPVSLRKLAELLYKYHAYTKDE